MEKLWTIDDVAQYLSVPRSTLYQWRSKGYGPNGIRIGRHVRYRPDDVQSWLASKAAA
jgi:excisionase family DNA binding protein